VTQAFPDCRAESYEAETETYTVEQPTTTHPDSETRSRLCQGLWYDVAEHRAMKHELKLEGVKSQSKLGDVAEPQAMNQKMKHWLIDDLVYTALSCRANGDETRTETVLPLCIRPNR
jgi:hypothetical protein